MSVIQPWNRLIGSPVASFSLTTSMFDIAPRFNANAYAATPQPGVDAGNGSGMTRLFGKACDAFADFFHVGPELQLAPAPLHHPGGAMLPDSVQRPSIMFMESEKFEKGRKAAHAARVRYETMPLPELERMVARHRTSVQSTLKTWADEIITHLGHDLWAGEDLPTPDQAHMMGFWKGVLARVDRVFQMTAQRTDEQSLIADTIVHAETGNAVGVSSDAFEEAVAKRLPDGNGFIALIRMYEEVHDIYISTLQPEIERRRQEG